MKCEYGSDLFICGRIVPHLNHLGIFRSSIRTTTDPDREVMNTIRMNHYHQFSTWRETVKTGKFGVLSAQMSKAYLEGW